MAFKYDIDKIFEELEQQAMEKMNQHKEVDDKKENTPIESPDDAPETQEVAPATSKTTEDTHGGDEASKEIKDSPNAADSGENSNKESNSPNPENASSEKEHSSSNSQKHVPKDLQRTVREFFQAKSDEQNDFRTQNRQEYLKNYILAVIKKIATEHAGIDKQDDSESFDKKQILMHKLKHQDYKILNDKYDLKDARYVQFFIDTSGVYGCGSNRIMQNLMPEIIGLLEKQGYECYIAACGNGFYDKDMVEDEYFETRKTLEAYKAGKVSKIACPTPETAAKMANDAEFSLILADFDGLSSICQMANLCQKDKVPYFLSTEDRYPWSDPALHNWVDPDLCDYDPKLIYDVSMDGNPTFEEYKSRQQSYDYDYDQDQEQNRNDGYDYDD